MGFDLDRFRALAFGRGSLPDHPMSDTREAAKLLALLPDNDPDYALAELTNWASSMNATESFSPETRAQVLMLVDAAALPVWEAQQERFLAPNGRPLEGRDGERALLQAMFDSATEFANGFALVLDPQARRTKWMQQSLARLYARHLRWLGRRLALAHTLNLPATAAIWEQLHHAHQAAEAAGVARTPVAVFEGERATGSARQEYVRSLLLELAAPDSLRPREIEQVYRVAAALAPTVRLAESADGETPFAVVPAGGARPAPLSRLPSAPSAAPLYIATLNCLPRLRLALERDMGASPGDPDTLYGAEFTVRERRATISRLLAYWGSDAPRRRSRRVAMASAARILSDFEGVLTVVPALEKAWRPGDVRKELQLQLDQTTNALRRSQMRAARARPARAIDASTGGLGLAIHRAEAPWARHGALVAVQIEPSNEWILGVVRRIFSIDQELRIGVQVLATRPRAIWLRPDAGEVSLVWEDAMREEASFREHFKRAILLEPLELPLPAAEFLLPPKLASRGARFEVPLAQGVQRIRVTRMADDNEHFQRAAFEPA